MSQTKWALWLPWLKFYAVLIECRKKNFNLMISQGLKTLKKEWEIVIKWT